MAIPNLSPAEVNGPHASKVYFDARKVVPHRKLAMIASIKPELRLDWDLMDGSDALLFINFSRDFIRRLDMMRLMRSQIVNYIEICVSFLRQLSQAN